MHILHYVTMTRYDDTFKGVRGLRKDNLKNTLGEVDEQDLNRRGLLKPRVCPCLLLRARGRFKGEQNSDPLAQGGNIRFEARDSAFEVKAAIVDGQPSLTILSVSFANGDVVGHTGVYSATDGCIGRGSMWASSYSGRNNGYTVIIIADHGNADNAINADGSPNTAHSLNPVPIILVSDKCERVENGILADVAPTILSIMGLPIPEEMTGKVLCR